MCNKIQNFAKYPIFYTAAGLCKAVFLALKLSVRLKQNNANIFWRKFKNKFFNKKIKKKLTFFS